MRWPSASSWTALAVMPPSAPMTWLSDDGAEAEVHRRARSRKRGRQVGQVGEADASGRCDASEHLAGPIRGLAAG